MGNSNQTSSSAHDKNFLVRQNFNTLYEYQSGQILSMSTSNMLPTLQSSPNFSISDYENYKNVTFYKSISFSSQQEMKEMCLILQKCKKMQENNENNDLCQILQIHKNVKNAMCSGSYFIQIFMQYSETTLFDEIQARINNNNQYFDFEDCCKIIKTSVQALEKVEKLLTHFNVKNQPNYMNRIFINPHKIFLMPSGMIKILSPLMVSTYDRFQYRNSSYYSPEKMSDFDFEDDSKSAIFQLGITLLHIFTLKDCHDIYNGFQTMEDVIDMKIIEIWNIYHNCQICQILRHMTRIQRAKRAHLNDVIFRSCQLQINLSLENVARKQSLPTITNFRLSYQINSIENSMPSARQLQKIEQKNDKYFPTEKIGLRKKDKKKLTQQSNTISNTISNGTCINQILEQKIQNKANEYVYESYPINQNQKSSKNLNKENMNNNQLQQSIVRSRTKFCKKQKSNSKLKQSVQYLLKGGKQCTSAYKIVQNVSNCFPANNDLNTFKSSQIIQRFGQNNNQQNNKGQYLKWSQYRQQPIEQCTNVIF